MLKVIKKEDGIALESDTDMVSFEELQEIIPDILDYATHLTRRSMLQSMPDDLKDFIKELTTKELIARFFAFFFAGVAIYCILKLYGVL